ncbi:MAG: RNA polymerase sigma factor [Chromatiales bacterium]
MLNLWPFRQDAHSRFEQLVGPHLKNLYRLAFRLTGQRDDAEDLVQDMLLKLYPRLEEMQAVDNLAPWLSRVLYRLFVDQHRRQQRSPIDLMGDEEVVYEMHASTDARPDEAVNADLGNKLINDALLQLSEEHRIVILLHDVEGYSLQEINEMLDIPVGTIKSRLSRARNKLREHLQASDPNFVDHVNTPMRLSK